ncbi:ABC transporter permease [Nocardioides sp. Kera G14]|uniref:ABC transporter permease n=1 Tax=Nocardioides sp. Kera G14 TaxID=2884264 RepID=UPI001D10FBF9|nr:ABC transporter permease [Nocardioides sp. Kera G14]UDY24412.1 ABC transporter permease [Nocardioides sp. Kera G14]
MSLTIKRPKLSWPVILLLIAAAILLIAIVRTVSDADDMASAGTVRAALRAAVPIGLAGLGGLWAERAGVVNIGLEGMMIMGTIGAGWAGYQWGMWAGVVAALAFGAIAGLLHAVATVSFGVDHIVSGVAINIIATGAAQYLAAQWFTGKQGGGPTQSPPVDTLPSITIPGVSDGLGKLAAHHWFFVSDLAALLDGFVSQLSILTVIAALLFVLTWWVLWRTTFGLRIRSVGEAPAAAESLGVDVYLYKYAAVIISGALAGLAGAFLVNDATVYREGQTGGRGYIGLAAMIFGNWRPGGLATGAGLFGYTDALRLRSGGASVHALLLLVAIVLIIAAVLFYRLRRSRGQAIGTVVFALVMLAIYLLIDEVPDDFTGMTPYLATLIVLSFAGGRLRPPAADGQVYRKGSAG